MTVPLLNFEGGLGVPLLNFEGGPGSRGSGSRGHSSTFAPCWVFLIVQMVPNRATHHMVFGNFSISYRNNGEFKVALITLPLWKFLMIEEHSFII